MNRFPPFISLCFFLVLVVGGGLAIGYLTTPGVWYAQLTKPAFTPPGWVFAPVWTVLYVMIAVAGWRTWRGEGSVPAMASWWAQLILNFLWSPVFFVGQMPGAALAIIVLLLVSIVAFIATSKDRTARILFVPYAAWVAFASVLNGSIVVAQ